MYNIPDRYIDPPDGDDGKYEKCECECHNILPTCDCDDCEVDDCECGCHILCFCDCEDGWIFVADDEDDDGDYAYDSWHDEC